MTESKSFHWASRARLFGNTTKPNWLGCLELGKDSAFLEEAPAHIVIKPKLPKPPTFTAEEVAYIIDRYRVVSAVDIAIELNTKVYLVIRTLKQNGVDTSQKANAYNRACAKSNSQY